ncbi:Peroxidase [Rhynchospora pubera]|uniref:Peroxidase n=2 Tax=Rhynchospora pubera TaxID=906938 RepID=A0AAV8FMH6_9POAL|nr:Peroxidase [Rhynchospora pubera]
MTFNMASLVYSVLIIFVMAHVIQGQGLQKGFYSKTCPKVEDIVKSSVQKAFNNDVTVAPGLLRLHFHDCFVQGCDASVLISGTSTERTAFANANLRGFEVIDDAKTQLETSCPGVVSCADIVALAARDAVGLTGGPSWSVELGRRDGTVSSASDVSNLPAPTDSVAIQRKKFSDKGLTDQDLVTLVGAHTIGRTACQFVQYRLFNYTGTGNADPSISPSFLSQMQSLCPQNGDSSKRIPLDKGSENKFDVSYFKNLRDGNGVLESDQRLWSDSNTKSIVQNYAGTIRGLLGLRFDYEFPKSMVKMGEIGVKTGSQGEIRKICSQFN